MHTTHNTLSEDIRTQTAEILNRRLAAAIDLHGQLKQAHWNVRGPTFIGVHELFDKVAGEAESYSDLLAERAAGLSAVAEGKVQVAAECSFLVPYPLHIADEKEHIFAVAATLQRSGNRPAKRSDSQRRLATLTRPISSPRYRAASITSFGLSNRMCSEMSETARFAMVRRDNPDGSRKIVTAPMTINRAAATSGTDPLGSGSFDEVAA